MCRFASHFEITGEDAAGLQQREIGAHNPLKSGDAAAASSSIGPAQDGLARPILYVEAGGDAAQALGATTVLPAVDVPGGPLVATFTDPGGNLIELTKRPQSRRAARQHAPALVRRVAGRSRPGPMMSGPVAGSIPARRVSRPAGRGPLAGSQAAADRIG
jgi:hypothetical protein